MTTDTPKPTSPSAAHEHALRLLRTYLLVLFSMAVLLGMLHLRFAGLSEGGVRWFNLDRERNLPTWFSGVLFFLLGAAAIANYGLERYRNSESGGAFRWSALWLGVAAVGFWMSLDETTVLHENLFWVQVRQFSDSRAAAWIYLTQWQVVFAPLMLAVAVYLVLFFANRLAASEAARRAAFSGLGCWFVSQFLEGLRQGLKLSGDAVYLVSVLVEEELEIAGALLLLAALCTYGIGLATDFSPARRAALSHSRRFLTRRTGYALAVLAALVTVAVGVIYQVGQRQAQIEAPVPSLIERARERYDR